MRTTRLQVVALGFLLVALGFFLVASPRKAREALKTVPPREPLTVDFGPTDVGNEAREATDYVGSTDVGLTAREAPKGMTQFNVTCPTARILPLIDAAHKACRAGSESSCRTFVLHFQQQLPAYDCQRSFDATPTVKYIVPALAG